MRRWALAAVAVIVVGLAHPAPHARAEWDGGSGPCVVSWYELGESTASGERFDPASLTAAHRALPYGARVRVVRGDRVVDVTITDRGPQPRDRDLDLARGAFERIAPLGAGVVVATCTRLAGVVGRVPEPAPALPDTGDGSTWGRP